MGTRPLAHAGRRSAGLGGDGRARPVAHAVGVWARFRHTDAVRRGRGRQDVWRNGVCKTLAHIRLFTTRQRYIFSGYGKDVLLSSASIRPCEARNPNNPTPSDHRERGVGLRHRCARLRVEDTLLCPPGLNA